MGTQDELYDRIKGMSYARQDEQGREVRGFGVPLPGRTEVRHRRCQNCQHFATDDAFMSEVDRRMVADGNAKRLVGATEGEVQAYVDKMRRVLLETPGVWGACQKRIARRDPQAADHFTHFEYLCDTWTGAFGQVFGPEVGPVDKLPEELLDDRGEALPRRPEEAEDDA
jgi:hypothetical protein